MRRNRHQEDSLGPNSRCARCVKFACYREEPDQAPANCPTQTRAEPIWRSRQKYHDPEIREFARSASLQEFEGYLDLPEGKTPRHPRIEETARFAQKMGYAKLGVAFCIGLRREASVLSDILEKRGFEIVSVCCKAGAVPKEEIGIAEEEKVGGPGVREAMCNPIGQAEILNAEGTHFNIAVGLCVGHDSLFFRHAKAPTTVLIAKDRVFGHNPAAGLYLSESYYCKLRREESNPERG